MRATFFEYNVAMRGLFTAQSNLQVISHNLANAAIPGYTRQHTLQRASRPISTGNGRGMYGTGSEVYGIAQIRDAYLDRKFWHQKGIQGEFATKNTQLSLMETVFSELNDSNVLACFNGFFQRLQDLSTTVPDATYRTNVINAAETLAEMVRSNAEALLKQQQDVNREISDVINIINSLGNQIASLNNQIHIYEMDGSNANDLRDQRALLVDTLSEFINVDVKEYDYSSPNNPHNKRYSVLINGYDFVNHTRYNPLMVVPRDGLGPATTTSGFPIPGTPIPKHNEMDPNGLFDIYFAHSGDRFNIYHPALKGTLRGLVDIRDGNNLMTTQWVNTTTGAARNTPPAAADIANYRAMTTNNYKGIPFYMNKLNHMVQTFSRAMNEGLSVTHHPIAGVTGHMHAFDYNGNYNENLFFTYIRSENINGTGHKTDFIELFLIEDNAGNRRTFNPVDPLNPDASVPIDFTLVRNEFGTPVRTLDYSRMTALNFTVNPQLTTASGWQFLACSPDRDQGQSSNSVIIGLQSINSYTSLFREGKLIDFIIGTSDHMSIDKNQAKNFTLNYEEILLQTENQRLSVSGVNINEEVMDMLKYNQQYQALAKLIAVINSIYDIMINRLGAF
jgi:flagellar hook-associated protein 1 FlgK